MHVRLASRREGIGTQLLARVAAAVSERTPATGLYRWVLEQNVGAQPFYGARGGLRVERAPVTPPGGVPGRLNGTPAKLRYV